MRVVVMGCGRVGASLAGALDRIGHEVAVIDRDSSAFQRLSPEFTGERVLGMGFDRDVLLRAGIEGAGELADELRLPDAVNPPDAHGRGELTVGGCEGVGRAGDAPRRQPGPAVAGVRGAR